MQLTRRRIINSCQVNSNLTNAALPLSQSQIHKVDLRHNNFISMSLEEFFFRHRRRKSGLSYYYSTAEVCSLSAHKRIDTL